jgi:hypothetical protein
VRAVNRESVVKPVLEAVSAETEETFAPPLRLFGEKALNGRGLVAADALGIREPDAPDDPESGCLTRFGGRPYAGSIPAASILGSVKRFGAAP